MPNFQIPSDHTKWPKENDHGGNVEYKSYISKASIQSKMDRLITQLLWRLEQGADDHDKYDAHYILGVHDEGQPSGLLPEELQESIEVMESVCKRCDAEIKDTTIINTNLGNIAVLHIASRDQDIKPYPVMGKK